ncbi:MAG: serine protease, partial [Bosea sp. (in: a-proteobacteria)]
MRAISLGVMLSAIMLAMPAMAQAPDPRIAAAQGQFDVLPEPERKAIQADLIWTGDFEGAGTGGYGPLTFRAVNAFKARVTRGEANGVLTAPERKLLADAAKAARDKAGFEIVTDQRSGVRIGIPQKLLPKRDVNPSGGSRWQSADQKVTLDTRAPPKGETLQQIFDKATANTVQGRRITYKLIRPDFYVISGETATGKFYSRLASGADGLRGFSIGYDKAL